MGCFSYLCKECGLAINSDSSRGERVKLFYLKGGEVIQQMEGEYNSYGQVFDESLKESISWKGTEDKNFEDWYKVWYRMIDEHHNSNLLSGFAAIHSVCFKRVPITISKDDENQGWAPLNPQHMPESEHAKWYKKFVNHKEEI